jgi:single-strand DNA-binding protein
MNKAILIGRLGKDAELKPTKGDPVCKFSIATEERWKNQRGEKQSKTTWHNCVLWGKRGEALSRYLQKGGLVMVEGQIDNRSYEDDKGNKRYVTEIKVTEIELLGGGKGNGGGGRASGGGDDFNRGGGDDFGGGTAPEEGGDDFGGAGSAVDDDVPF